MLLFLTMLVMGTGIIYAQQRQISGKVIAQEDGQALPGVSVSIKGTSIGTITDQEGRYRLNVSGSPTLVFTFVGYSPLEVMPRSGNSLDVALTLNVESLNEVVIGAQGLQTRKREQGYNATSIGSSLITQGKSMNAVQGLTGKVAGLQINTVGSGVNPSVRLVLRGHRSLLGNNQALIVLDNVIVPNAILSNLNPEDIQEITVLNGSNAAALYGSDASNGALIVTTKKGKRGVTTINLSNTTNVEQLSFYPKTQSEFGSGSTTGLNPVYTPFENQQYGPRFDGVIREIGHPLEDGRIEKIPYAPSNDHRRFWKLGITNQTDFSVSSGDEKSTLYFAAQYVTQAGTTPKDKYNRASLRLNGTRDFGKGVSLDFSTNYVQNTYDITTVTNSIYAQLLETPAQIPITRYKDWQNNPFANPNGYYNDYYQNPYFTIDNFRRDQKNNYLIGKVELKWKPVDWLDFTYRIGVSNRTNTMKESGGVFTYSDYTKNVSTSKTDYKGAAYDYTQAFTQLNSDFLVQFRKNVRDFSFNLVLGNSIRANTAKEIGLTATGLITPGLYNISNRVGEPGASEGSYQARQVGLYGDLKVGFRDYLFLELTGRNDWVSILAPENRSFFYPSASLSFIPTDAIPALKNSDVLSSLKLRGGWSQVGMVNLGTPNNFGAYSLLPTFNPTGGFPYGNLSGYSLGDRLVSPNLKPEMTTGVEAGFDINLLRDKISASFTWYRTRTKDQAVPTGVSSTTGFYSYLQNTGLVSNEGIEITANYMPVQTDKWEVTVGGNYTYNNNKVISISGDLPRLGLSTGGSAQVYAVENQPFPVLIGTVYNKDPQGRIIVDRNTGYPSVKAEPEILGSTVPKHRLGLNASVSFKNWRLYTLFEYRGDYVILFESGEFDFSGSGITTAFYNRERFVMPNSSYEDPNKPGTYIPNTNITVTDGGMGFWTASNYRRGIAENYVISGDYWKWRELAISYTLPETLLKRTGFIKGATISAQGRNLFIWTPKSNLYTDPEFNFADSNAIGLIDLRNTPPTRFYGGTISLTF